MIQPVAVAALVVSAAWSSTPAWANVNSNVNSDLAGSAAGGGGGSTPDVSLEIERCPLLPRDEILRLAVLELDAAVADPARASLHTTRVQISCEGRAVRLVVSDPLTGKQLIRTMTLATREVDVDARLVALAASELVITSWMELTLTLPGAVLPPAEPSASPDLRRAAQDRVQRLSVPRRGTGYVLLLAQAVGPFAGVGVGWGGGLRGGWVSEQERRWGDTLGAFPAVDLELTGARADSHGPIGDVRVSTWSAALRGALRFRHGRAWLDLGAGGRFGLARIEGTPADPATVRGGALIGTWAGPIAYLGVGVRIWRLVVATGIEGGQVLRTVDGLVDGGTAVSISGRWLSGSVAMGWGG